VGRCPGVVPLPELPLQEGSDVIWIEREQCSMNTGACVSTRHDGHMRLPLILAIAGTALIACSAPEDRPSEPPVALPSSAPCPVVPAEGGIPVECVGGETGFDVTPAPVSTEGAPASSADIPSVVLDRLPRDLVLGGNDTDPSLARKTFRVTVPTGARLAATVACRGYGELSVTTAPRSEVELAMPCGQQQAIDLTVLDPDFEQQPATYEVTVSAPTPARWYVALGAETDPPPE
jgi:hypothetical protein